MVRMAASCQRMAVQVRDDIRIDLRTVRRYSMLRWRDDGKGTSSRAAMRRRLNSKATSGRGFVAKQSRSILTMIVLVQALLQFGEESSMMEILGTDPMADGGINKWTPPRKSGDIPGVSTRFSLNMENEKADAGRDETAEPVSRDQISGANGDREIFTFPVQLATSRIGNLTRLIHTLLYVMTIRARLVS